MENKQKVYIFAAEGEKVEVVASSNEEALELLKQQNGIAYIRKMVNLKKLPKPTNAERDNALMNMENAAIKKAGYSFVQDWLPNGTEYLDNKYNIALEVLSKQAEKDYIHLDRNILPPGVAGTLTYGFGNLSRGNRLHQLAPVDEASADRDQGYITTYRLSEKLTKDTMDLATITNIVQTKFTEGMKELIKKGKDAVLQDISNVFTQTPLIKIPIYSEIEIRREDMQGPGFNSLGADESLLTETLSKAALALKNEAENGTADLDNNEEVDRFIDLQLSDLVSPFTSLQQVLLMSEGNIEVILTTYFQQKAKEFLENDIEVQSWLETTGYEDIALNIVPNTFIEFGKKILTQFLTIQQLKSKVSLSVSGSALYITDVLDQTFDNLSSSGRTSVMNAGKTIAEEILGEPLNSIHSEDWKKEIRLPYHILGTFTTVYSSIVNNHASVTVPETIVNTIIENHGIQELLESEDEAGITKRSFEKIVNRELQLDRDINIFNTAIEDMVILHPTYSHTYSVRNNKAPSESFITPLTSDMHMMPIYLGKDPYISLLMNVVGAADWRSSEFTIKHMDPEDFLFEGSAALELVRYIINQLILPHGSLGTSRLEAEIIGKVWERHSNVDKKAVRANIYTMFANIYSVGTGLRNLLDLNGTFFTKDLIAEDSILFTGGLAFEKEWEHKRNWSTAISSEEIFNCRWVNWEGNTSTELFYGEALFIDELQNKVITTLQEAGLPVRIARVMVDSKNPLNQLKSIERGSNNNSIWSVYRNIKGHPNRAAFIREINRLVLEKGLPCLETVLAKFTRNKNKTNYSIIVKTPKGYTWKAIQNTDAVALELELSEFGAAFDENIKMYEAAAKAITDKADDVYNLVSGIEELMNDFLSMGVSGKLEDFYSKQLQEIEDQRVEVEKAQEESIDTYLKDIKIPNKFKTRAAIAQGVEIAINTTEEDEEF